LVSKIVTKDERYKKEKQYKKQQLLERKKAYNREYCKSYVRSAKEKEDREEYYKLLARIYKDNKVLSTKTEMSDVDFAKWNRSIYDYANNSSNLVVKKDINVTFDVPKIVRNVVQASSIRSSRVY
jgi:enolase